MSVPPVTLGGRLAPSPAVTFLGKPAHRSDTPPGSTFQIPNRSFDRTCSWPERDEDVHRRVTAYRCTSACRVITGRSTKQRQPQQAYLSATTSLCSWRSRTSSKSRRTCIAERTQANPSSRSLLEGPLDSEKPPESLAARGALISVAQPESCCSMSVPDAASGPRDSASSVLRLPRRGEGVR